MTDSRRSRSAVALRTENVSWHVQGVQILRDVSLEVRAGEFVSVIGPNGAGKSSLINVISGLAIPQSGTVELDGVDITRRGMWERARQGLGRSFQTSSLFLGLDVRENVRLAAQARLGGSLSLVRRPRLGDDATRRAMESLERIGLASRASTLARDLSHGDKRKLELAIIHVQEPKVVLLDEPTAGASVEDVDGMVELIQGVHAAGATVVMVEHRVELVARISDRIAVMHDGQLLRIDEPALVLSDPRVRQAYLGIEDVETVAAEREVGR